MIPLRYNTRNLVVRWLTSLLVVAIFTLVIAILVVLLAFVEGLNALSKKTGPEGNVIILREGATDELFSDLVIDANLSKLYNNHPEVVVEDGKPLASLEIYAIATQELPAKDGERPTYRFLQVRGVEEPEMSGKVHRLPLKPGGRWFTRAEPETVLGQGIANTLGKGVNDTIMLPPIPEPIKVVGILDSHGSPFDSEIWTRREDVGRYLGKDNEQTGQRFYTSVVVTTKDLATAEDFAKALQERVREVRLHAMTERKYYEEMSKSNQMFLTAALFISFVFGLGAMFGLMTVMFAAVSQRIKDIGLLRILGYARWKILLSFLLESVLLSLVGGGLGLLLGYLVNGVEQTSFVSSGQGGGKTVVFSMIVNRTVISYALGFIATMGILGGLLPALSAMRLKVLDAVR